MNWLDVIKSRHTTFAWDEDRVPEKELIEDVLKEVYEHIPSKNRQFPYQLRILRNDDPEIRKEIMGICHRNKGLSVEDDPGNPQILAPWLIGLNARYVADLEKRYEKTSVRGKLDGLGKGKKRSVSEKSQRQTQTENIEIGIVSAYIMLAMANRGIQSGMCQNICNNYERASEIFEIDNDARALDFRFIMGVGYGKDNDTLYDYVDPRIDKIKSIPFRPTEVEKWYPSPEFSDIIKWIK